MKFSLTNNRATLLVSCALVASVACGNNDNNAVLPDARNDIDAARINADAGLEPVSVTVLDLKEGTPAATVGVIFQNPDGTLILRTTDAFGATSAVVQPGASVTVDQSAGGNGPLFRSILAIQPGDSLMFGAIDSNGSNGTLYVSVQITVPTPPEDSTGGIYFADSCGGSTGYNTGTTVGTIGLPPGCTVGSVAVATQPADGNDFVEYLAAPSQSLFNAQISIPGPWLASPAGTVTIENVPSQIIVDGVGVAVASGTNQLFGVYQSGTGGYQSSVVVTHHVPPVGDNVQVDVSLDDSAAGGHGDQEVLSSSLTGTSTIDASNVLLPWIDSATTFDDATRTIQWTTNGTGTPDVVMLAARYTVANGDSVEWAIIAPGDVTSVVLPTLPPVLTAFDASQDELGYGFEVQLVGSRPSVDYATIRANTNWDPKDAARAPWAKGNLTISQAH